MKAFSEQLNEARKAANMTQEQLAEQLNISRQSISGWERDCSQPDLETIARLSRILDYKFILPEENHAPEEPAKPSSVSRKKAACMAVSGFIAGLLVMFLIMQFAVPALQAYMQPDYGSVPDDIVPQSTEWFTYDRRYSEDSAIVNISYSDNPSLLVADERYGDGYGWLYTFYLTEENGIDFFLDSYTEYYVVDGMAVNHTEYTADDMIMWWGESSVPAGGQRAVRGGMPQHDISGVGLKISGKDATGAQLDFYGYLELSQEIASE